MHLPNIVHGSTFYHKYNYHFFDNHKYDNHFYDNFIGNFMNKSYLCLQIAMKKHFLS